MQVKKGDLIFRQGQKGDQAYLIENGQVEIFHTHKNDQESLLAVLGEGEIFGEMALIDSNIRSASTRALSDCRLLVIERDQLLERIESSDVVVQLMVRILMKRLRQQNQSKSGVAVENLTTDLSSAGAVEKLKLEHDLYEAYHKNEFRIFHQPVKDLHTGRIMGSEALIRWESPAKGLVSPGKFIDVLEHSSMIIPVGYWIFEECFRHHNAIMSAHPGLDFSISINVSGKQFLHLNFVDTIRDLAAKHKVNPENFKLEVTERIMMEGAVIVDIMNRCRGLGFQISLDDFGTGFSSLQYLSQMPINYLKIDRSFVMSLSSDPKAEAVVSSIIYLAKKLKLKVIAEGIETEKEAFLMKELGSDYGQGYLFARPLPFEKLLESIK